MNNPSSSVHARRTGPTRQAEAQQQIDSVQLLSGQKELIILHAGEQYRLRCTRQGKLILTK